MFFLWSHKRVSLKSRTCRGTQLLLETLEDRTMPSTMGILATGADAGGGPRVNVYDENSVLKSSFFAYDPAFTGGVRVAVADVNGDGIPDIITGAGAGGGPHVKVFSGMDGTLLQSFFAYDPAFTGGVYVGAGDVNGDGIPDIITGAGAGGGPHVKVFSGKDGTLLQNFYAYDPAFTGGVHVAVGDVNGDGFADIVTGVGPGGGPHVKVFSGMDRALLQSFYAYDPAFTGGVHVAVGDVNGDGFADIITGVGPGGGPHVKAFRGLDGLALQSFFAYEPSFAGGVRVGVVVDGNGKANILTAPGPSGGPHVKLFDSANLGIVDSFFAYDPHFTGGISASGLSFNEPVPQATTSGIISAAQGGTLTLPDGSSVSIPAGALANDQLVTFSLFSSLPRLTPSGIISSVGPSLVLSFGPAVLSSGSAVKPAGSGISLTSAQASTAGAGIQATLNLGSGSGTGLQGSASMAVVELSDGQQFVGIPGSMSNNQAIMTLQETQNATRIVFSQANLSPFTRVVPPPALPTGKVWNGNGFVDLPTGFNPNHPDGTPKRILMVVHGVLSNVDTAWGQQVAELKQNGHYDEVLGFDYDFRQGVEQSGAAFATVLNVLRNSYGVAEVDVAAHSMGGLVALSGWTQAPNDMIENLSLLGVPITGTPAANSVLGLQYALGQLPGPLSSAVSSLGILPDDLTLQDVFGSQGAQDLAEFSPAVLRILAAVNAKLPTSATKFFAACGDAIPDAVNPLIPGWFSTSDGLVPCTNALGEGTGLLQTRIIPLGTNGHFPVLHTDLEVVFSRILVQLTVPNPPPPPPPPPPPIPPPPSTSLFAGSYTGSYAGTGQAFGFTDSVSGGVAFTVGNNGAITVTTPGGGSGTVSSSGAATIAGAGGIGSFSGVSYSFSGTFVISSSGAATASGGWSATFSGGNGSGTWSAHR